MSFESPDQQSTHQTEFSPEQIKQIEKLKEGEKDLHERFGGDERKVNTGLKLIDASTKHFF